MVCPRGVSLIESGRAIKVETHNKGRDAKGPTPIALRIALVGKKNRSVLSSEHKRPPEPTLSNTHDVQNSCAFTEGGWRCSQVCAMQVMSEPSPEPVCLSLEKM